MLGMAPPRKHFVTMNQRFGRGIVIDPEVPYQRTGRAGGERGVRLRCDCGTEYVAPISHLVKGNVISCGCARSESAARNMRAIRGLPAEPAWRLPPTHGLWGHPLYYVWKNMLDRCENPRNSRYARYGGRGIAVCERWHDIRLFIADIESTIGPKPARCPECGGRYSLDRIENSGGYKTGNVRWTTATVQNGNQGD